MTRLDEHGERIIAFIRDYQEAYRCSPSYEEIGTAVGLPSKDHVSRDLRKLKEQGYISFTPGMSRSIVLLKDTRRRSRGGGAIPVPVVCVIPGDEGEPPAYVENEPLDWVSVARELLGDDRDVHVWRVRGNSMLDALVNDGDLVVIKPKRTAQDGDMVAAWLKPQQMMTLKYYHRENGHVRLQPANPTLPAMQVCASDIEIQGQVLAIVRKAH
jgi:repressor LexA